MLKAVRRLIKKIFNKKKANAQHSPAILQRSDHGISRSNISEHALKVLYRLKAEGHEAYLVGGGVRDLMLGREPKDFDVATDATPEQIRRIFRNCRLIGRRFRLAHVFFGQEIIEVATFRAAHEENEASLNREGMLLRDNVYGSLEEDAWRRDFTVNSLYYNIRDFSVVDYTGGVADLMAGRLRLIGDPEQRYREDPVRMLRAVRFAAKLGFAIEARTESAIFALGGLMQGVAAARLYDECLKLFLAGFGLKSFELLRHYDLFGQMFPRIERVLATQQDDFPRLFIANGLRNSDARVEEGKPVTPAFLFAVLLWDVMRERAGYHHSTGMNPIQAYHIAGDEVFSEQVRTVAIPKRFSQTTREIWDMQARLEMRPGRKSLTLLDHPRFRAGYDFLLLRAESGEDVQQHVDWWTALLSSDDEERNELVRTTPAAAARPKRRRRPRKRKPNAASRTAE